MLKDLLFVGVGYVVGAFTPSVLRRLKALFSAEVAKGVSFAEVEVKKAEGDVKSKL